MGMVSPPVVGLILICLIGGLSEAIPTHESHYIHSKFSRSSPPSPHPCTASWFLCNKAKLFSPRRKDSYDVSLSAPEIKKGLTVNNRTGYKITRKGLAHVLARTKSAKHFGKIAERDMKEESRIPPEELDISDNPRERQKYSTVANSRFDPQTVSSLEHLLNSLLRNRNHQITLSVDEEKRDNYFVKLFENLPNIRSSNKKRSPVSTTETPMRRFEESGSYMQKPLTTISDKSLLNSIHVGDLTRRPKIKTSHSTTTSTQTVKEAIRTRKPKTRKNSPVTANPLTDISNNIISLTTPFTFENQTHKSRRSGRNFALVEDSKLEGGKERNHTGIIGSLFTNKTVLGRLTDKAKTFNDLFNYSYQISAMERGSLFPHDPFPDTDKEFGKRSSFISPFDVPDHELQVDAASSSNNTSVYNSLRPRLRTTKSQVKTTFGQRPSSFTSLTSQIPKSGTTPRTTFRIKMLLTENKDVNTSLPITDTNSTVTSDFNNTHTDLLKLDSLVLFPKRIDSSFARGFDKESLNNNVKTPKSSPIQKGSRSANSSTSIPRRITVRERNSTERYRYSIGKSRQINSNRSNPLLPKLNKTIARNVDVRESTLPDFFEVTTMPNIISETLLRKISETLQRRNSSSGTERSSSRETETSTGSPEADVVRKPKMTDASNSENVAVKKPKIDPKSFYDYLMKASMGDAAYNFTIPEFLPGNLYRYDGIYARKPVMDMAYSRPPPFFKVRLSTKEPTTTEMSEMPTTFESMRTSLRVSSTFYPNRMQDITMRFGNVPEPPTTLPSPELKEGEADESEFRDAVQPGFTMEKLAYLLIGTCCGLSILCLCVVVIAIKCRRALVEKRIKAQFQRRLYQHERMKDSPWQHQMFDHFVYLHGQPDNSSRSSANSCSCRCVTWSLGARNLEASRPLCPSNSRSSLYLCGQKKLPFGAASTLRYESMLGHKSPTPGQTARNESQNSDSSHENDSLEQNSDSRDSTTSRHCTCINYTMWPMPGDVRRGMYGLCPTAGHYVAGDCSHHSPEDMGAMPRNCPPPVTGSNYLDRSEGVVYWSSNDERLI
ncbi:uncharacterized protein NPIL_565431 [Nephila pilipes]|uniref:Uncharacterized protein n=1 Tax=Nephila pilipes TaxID=299642 RepID=A0A8X6TKI2_NEPPI|nr:uncharacterized protein NPIL_565431 [Nephila pilipes]